VHLAVPRPDPLNAEPPPKPSASVLIRYRGTRAPISVPDVQRLVAGAVPGLSPDAVAVILAPAVTAPPARNLVRLGPFSTPRETANQVRLLAAGVALLDIALVGCLVTVWLRLRRLTRPGRPGNER
jgi:type III secretory pathway lipoprotein EscJ